ncbi:MAG: Gfo/Idh/MocA family oxidoreductase [Candidatus Scalindua sp.]|nr:Gfo/Idh/MocA family oxidoreductase [Candidatus Scalindua sp.]
MYKIALIGAGQIGSRHLQALAKIEIPISVEVVSRTLQSLVKAKERFEKTQGSGFVKSIKYLQTIKSLSSSIDIAIIATNADVRRKVIEELIQYKKTRFLLLEKVVFQSIHDFHEIIELLKINQVKAWVNCPRRMYTFYLEVKKHLGNGEPIVCDIRGGNWGMGCNSIHFIDLISYVSREIDFSITRSDLDPKILTSKREGFLEFAGSLHGVTRNGSKFSLISDKESNVPCVINITGDTSRYIIFESEGKAIQAHKSKNWKDEEVQFSVPYQSQLTHIAVSKILVTEQSDLTPLELSFEFHKPLLETFTQHLEHIVKQRYGSCPIT